MLKFHSPTEMSHYFLKKWLDLHLRQGKHTVLDKFWRQNLIDYWKFGFKEARKKSQWWLPGLGSDELSNWTQSFTDFMNTARGTYLDGESKYLAWPHEIFYVHYTFKYTCCVSNKICEFKEEIQVKIYIFINHPHI